MPSSSWFPSRDLTITAGVKDAFYPHAPDPVRGRPYDRPARLPSHLRLPSLSQAAPPPPQHAQNYNSILPSVEANYRINNNASVYGQYGRGSIAPFSSVFDTTGAQVAVTPPPTIADTYQGGTVVKLNRFAFDADVYHIHFTNTYSTYTDSTVGDPNYGFTYYYANPNSDTNGFEAEGNYAVTHSLSFNANGTFGVAKYEASAGIACCHSTRSGNIITPPSPPLPRPGLPCAPHDTESMGLTYREKGTRLRHLRQAHRQPLGRHRQLSPDRSPGSVLDEQPLPELQHPRPLDLRWLQDQAQHQQPLRRPQHRRHQRGQRRHHADFDDRQHVPLKVTQNHQLYTPSWADTLEKQAGRAIMISFQFGLTRTSANQLRHAIVAQDQRPSGEPSPEGLFFFKWE